MIRPRLPADFPKPAVEVDAPPVAYQPVHMTDEEFLAALSFMDGQKPHSDWTNPFSKYLVDETKKGGSQ